MKAQRRRGIPVLVLALLLPCVLAAQAQAASADLLQKVLDEGRLRCGVSKSIPGLAVQDKSGAWSGMDVDVCRALAAALFGSADKARFVPLSAVERFPALLAGRVDLISGSTTWTLAREVGLKVSFVGPVVFSAQRVVVRADSDITSLAQLQNRDVCVTRGTTHVQHLQAYFSAKGFTLRAKPADSHVEARAAFEAGTCVALSADEAALASMVPAGVAQSLYRLLPETISNEPLSAVLPAGNPGLERVVRWVLFMLISAESNGIDQRTAASLQPGSPADVIAANARRYGPAMGLSPNWAEHAVAAVGNYGEIFERNLGSGSAIGLARGVNRPADQGGMLYSPPLH